VGLGLLLLVPHNLWVGLWEAGQPATDLAAVLLAALLALAAGRWGRRPWPRFWLPGAAFLGISLLSLAVNRVPAATAAAGLRETLPYVALGLLAGRFLAPAGARRLAGWLVVLGGLVAVYGVSGYLAFRFLGGRRAIPPAPESAWLAALTYPYYCGHYLRGWRLVSTFMNDNYLGVWMALTLPLGWVWTAAQPAGWRRRLGWLTLGLMVVALTWTYSRGAALAAVVSLGGLAARISWRAGWLLVPAVLAGLLMLTPADVVRFSNPGATEGNRVARLNLAGKDLARRPILGNGPGRGGLMDMQYGKVARETGLLGLGVFLWLLGAAVMGAWRGGGPWGAAIAFGLLGVAAAAIGGEDFENPQIAATFWLLAGMAPALAAGVGGGRREARA